MAPALPALHGRPQTRPLVPQGPQRRGHQLAQLPALARNVRSAVLAETGGGKPRSVVPQADLLRLLQQAHTCCATPAELREQLALLAAEAPGGWLAQVETQRGLLVKMDNRVSFPQVLAALKARSGAGQSAE